MAHCGLRPRRRARQAGAPLVCTVLGFDCAGRTLDVASACVYRAKEHLRVRVVAHSKKIYFHAPHELRLTIL